MLFFRPDIREQLNFPRIIRRLVSKRFVALMIYYNVLGFMAGLLSDSIAQVGVGKVSSSYRWSELREWRLSSQPYALLMWKAERSALVDAVSVLRKGHRLMILSHAQTVGLVHEGWQVVQPVLTTDRFRLSHFHTHNLLQDILFPFEELLRRNV